MVGRRAEHLEALFREALEVVRARAGLERAAAQEFRAAFRDGFGGFFKLLGGFDGTRASHDDEVLAADRDAGDVDDAVFGVEFAADELVFFRDADGLFDAGHHVHFEVGDDFLVADNADDRTLLADGKVRGEADGFDFLRDAGEVFFRGCGFHDDDHGWGPPFGYVKDL